MTPQQGTNRPALAEQTPEQIFLANLSTIDSLVQTVARQRRMTSADAEEFAAIARLRLIEDDYVIIRKFRGGSSLRTYLTVVIARLALDYCDACWGRWRPSAAARRLGPTAVILERMMVRDDLSFDEAWGTLPAGSLGSDRDALRAFAEQLRGKVKRRWVPLDDLEDGHAGMAVPEVETLMREDRRVAAALARSLRTLGPEDSRLLKLRFSNGMSIPSIARREGLDQASLYRRVAALLRRMRRELESSGIAAPAI